MSDKDKKSKQENKNRSKKKQAMESIRKDADDLDDYLETPHTCESLEMEMESLVNSKKNKNNKKKRTKGENDNDVDDDDDDDDNTSSKRGASFTERFCALITLLFLISTSKPNACLGVLGVVLLILVITMIHAHRLEMRRYHPYKAFISRDYSTINSELELELGGIDHWCIFGENDGCVCDDPLDPISHAEVPGWIRAHKANVQSIREAVNTGRRVDVAFIGDSLTEEWSGRFLGRNITKYRDSRNMFQSHFNKQNNNGGGGGEFDGLALGIAGDASPNLLWRLKHGEMPWDFNPRVWWILIGVEDLVRGGCSAEVALLGILRVVEEIMGMKPDATIVINGILPSDAYSYEKRVDRGGMKGGAGAGPVKIKKKKNKGGAGGKEDEEVSEEELEGLTTSRRGRRAPIMPSIKEVNRELADFASNHEKVKYFEPGTIFLTSNNGGSGGGEKGKGKGKKGASRKEIDHDLIGGDGVHPTNEGRKMWIKKILKKLDVIFTKLAEEEEAALSDFSEDGWPWDDDDIEW